jgi:putative spermidine/putrescine transport system ATP-binding protein
MTDPTGVHLEQVTKRYGSLTVLEDFDLQVGGGELLCLLGPSGCGKTTALRLVAGFERPERGTVRLGARDVTAVSARRRGVGVVFQSYSLFPHLSALDNVAYGLRVRGLRGPARATRARELLELVGLGSHAGHFPHQLSGGQQQRVALARALAVEPSVLLLDEPLSALDAQVRSHLRDEIRQLQQRTGTTTVLVTHDQEEALIMSDRVAVMHDGRIEQIATPAEVYRRPATPFVASFVGVVNRVPARPLDGGAVDVLGHRVAARAGSAPAVAGVAGTALVRPEDLELVPTDAGDGVVVATTLRGAVTSIRVSWPGLDAPLRVDVPSSTAVQPAPGDRVAVRLREPDVHVDAPGPGDDAVATATAVAR